MITSVYCAAVYTGLDIAASVNMIPFDTARHNPEGAWHPQQPARLVVPAGVSKARVRGQAFYTANSATSSAALIYKTGNNNFHGRGAIQHGHGAYNLLSGGNVVTGLLDVTAGDSFTLGIFSLDAAINFASNSLYRMWLELETDPIVNPPVLVLGRSTDFVTTTDLDANGGRVIPWETEHRDTKGMWTSGGDIVIPSGVTHIRLRASAEVFNTIIGLQLGTALYFTKNGSVDFHGNATWFYGGPVHATRDQGTCIESGAIAVQTGDVIRLAHGCSSAGSAMSFLAARTWLEVEDLTGMVNDVVPTPVARTVSWDPAVKGPNIILSNNNLTVTQSGVANSASGVLANKPKSSGRWVFAFDPVVGGTTYEDGVGVGCGSASIFTGNNQSVMQIMIGPGGVTNRGTLAYGGAVTAPASATEVQVAVDVTNKYVWFRNGAGNWNNCAQADPALGRGGLRLDSDVFGPLSPYANVRNMGQQFTANFGASAFANPLPTGFGEWEDDTGSTELVFTPATHKLVESTIYHNVSADGRTGIHTHNGFTYQFRGANTRNAGKRYFEAKVTTSSGSAPRYGLVTSGAAVNQDLGSTGSYAFYSGNIRANGGAASATAPTLAVGDRVGIAVDFDTGQIWYAKNNTWILSGNPAAGTTPTHTFTAGTALHPACSVTQACLAELMLDSGDFLYAPPTGFSAF